MQVKTFKASTMEKAVAQIKKELGPDAVILGSRKVQADSGDFGFEVSAARELPSDPFRFDSADGGGASVEMQNDIQEIKSFLSLLISSRDQFAQLHANQPLAELYHSLLARGLNEKQVYVLLSKTLSDLSSDMVDRDRVLNTFCKRLVAGISYAKPFKNISGSSGSTLFTFLGPTGVGKTTTLAKLAAYLKIKRRMELGVISLDTYRIGAVDQLQTYAGILEVPFIVAQSKTELDGALDDFRHCEVVLIDTTGRNYLNREHVRHLGSLFHNCQKFNHLLVLSATAKDEDLRQTILHFREIQINSLIFTKVDETVNHGCILNQLLRFKYPISYMGIGQRVPEDIEPATQKRLLSFLLPVGIQTA